MDWFRNFHFSLPDYGMFFFRRTVILTVTGVIIYQGVGIFYKTLALQFIRMKSAPVAEKVRAAVVVVVREPADVYQVIPERNLFRTTMKADSEKQQPEVVQRDISLFLELKGTIAGDENKGFAIVEEKGNQRQRLVKVGDVVAGAKVIRIQRNSVDFLMDNQERTLKIVETVRPFFQPAASRAPIATPSGQDGSILIN
jgi:type II secretory pathway component PulC